MIVIPALDLKGGKVVQLVGGDFAQTRVEIPDVHKQVEEFYSYAIERLHIVDLDAAKSVGDNGAIIDAVLKDKKCKVEVGGGVRTMQKASDLIKNGADYVIVGTAAVTNPDFLKELAREIGPEKIIVSLDYKNKQVLTHGWDEISGISPITLIQQYEEFCESFLLTCVDVEGQLKGADTEYLKEIIDKTGAKVIASGGVNSHQDLQGLADVGVFGAVVGMALYKGHITLEKTTY